LTTISSGDALGRVWLLFGAGRALEDLDDHPEVVVSGEVGEVDAAEGAAEHQVVSPLGLRRHRVVEVRRADGDVVDAFALLGDEARPDALLVINESVCYDGTSSGSSFGALFTPVSPGLESSVILAPER
jgi:hypothetical protein